MRRRLAMLSAAQPADPTSLENLFDLVTPPPVPRWPPAPGWFAVGGVGLVLVVWTAWRAWKRWRAAAHRRAARAELRQLKTLAADPRQREAALRQLPELIKRTALAAFPREAVASLSGTSWLRFFDRTGRTNALTRPWPTLARIGLRSTGQRSDGRRGGGRTVQRDPSLD